MALHEDEAQRDETRTEQQEAYHWKSIENDKQRGHERQLRELDIKSAKELKKLEVDAATARLRATTRSDIVRRSVVAVVKLPTLPLALLFVFILQILRRDIPNSLDTFVDL